MTNCRFADYILWRYARYITTQTGGDMSRSGSPISIDNWDRGRKILTREAKMPLGTFVDDRHATEQRLVLETGQAQVQVRRADIGTHAKLMRAATKVATDYLTAPIQSELDPLA